MADLTPEEQFILNILKEQGGTMKYKKLQDRCANEFEGVRLILKKMKEKKLLDYDGIIPGLSAEIKLKNSA